MAKNVCLVVGCHPCYKEDMDLALSSHPDAKICAVNFATQLVHCDYLATVHGNLIPRFLEVYEHDNDPIIFQQDNDITGAVGTKINIPTHGGSGPFAAACMVLQGFDLAIMCGCPITGGGGYAQKAYVSKDWDRQKPSLIRKWVNGMHEYKAGYPDIANKIRSMSGNTKDIFGGLDDITH
jgi:hypothetical protein